MTKIKTSAAFVFMVLSIISMLYSSFSLADTFYESSQLNFTVDGKKWGIGGRFHGEKELKHYVLRFKANSRWLAQFRYVVRGENKQRERRYRIRHKSFRYGGFEFNAVFEYRHRDANSNNLRFRPQIIYKYDVDKQIALFYQLTPHWVYDFDKGGVDYRFARHKYGFSFRFENNDKVNLFVKTKTDQSWAKEESFFGLDYSMKF